MSNKAFRILIVDDDTALLKVLTTGLEKAGFNVVACAVADEAMAKARHSDFNLIIMDCMLPKTNGVDLALKIRKFLPNTPFVFISGIYKDRTFIQETLDTTGSHHFLLKPFNFSELQKIVETYAKRTPTFRPESWLEFWQELNANSFHKRLASLKSLNGQELPFIISLLLKCKSEGSLKVKLPEIEGEIFFSDSLITQLRSSDPTSFFGALLIQNGLLTEEEVAHHLQTKHPEPLGESLVKAQLLSPHAIEETLRHQTLLRISRLISTLPTAVEWKPAPPKQKSSSLVEAATKGIEAKDLFNFFMDWSSSKMKLSWLRSQYVTWLDDCPILMAKPNDVLPPDIAALQPLCKGQLSLNEVLKNFKDADKVLCLIHGLVLSQKLKWGLRKTQSPELERLRQKLENLENNFKEADHFTVLGLGTNAKEREIKKTYLDLSRSLHPDQLPPDSPEDLKALNSRVFTHVTRAHEALSDITSRESYVKELRFQSLKVQEASQESLYKALDMLDRKSYKQAFDLLNQIKKTAWQTQYLDLYCLWADIKRRDRINTEDARSFEKKMLDLPPEDRHSYLYFFVKGLLAIHRKMPEEAKSCFQNAMVLNPQFKHAAFELQTLVGTKGSLLNQIFNSTSSKKPA